MTSKPSPLTVGILPNNMIGIGKLNFAEKISNCYSVQRNLFKDIMASFIESFMPNISHLNPEFQPVVNA
uniref:hypothetical protein n=1 Tax=Methyloprofundus sedimenti TaxID=1420851 RepID=UPI00117E1FC1|nr:hypothetical protein [Methyloprofundus sedimenti]